MLAVPYWRLSAYYFSYFAFIGVFPPYFGLYLQSLSFSAGEIALLMSQMQLMRLFGPCLWGALADRFSLRLQIVRVSSLVALMVFAGFFFIRRFETLLAAMIILSFFWCASLPLVEALTFDHLRENSARYSRIRLWGSVGFIAAVMSAGVLLDYFPVSILLWASIAVLAGIVICSLIVPESPVHHSFDDPLPVGKILGQSKVKALLVACFAMSAAHATLNIFYSIFLSDYGYSKTLVGGLFSLGVLVEIVVFFFMSGLMRRFSLRRILLVTLAVAVVRFVLIGWGVQHLAMLALAQLMHGLTFGAFHAAAIAAVNHWFPGRARARGQAIYSSVSFGAGGLFGGLMSGWAWDYLGSSLAFALGSVYALAGFIVVAKWIDETDGNERKLSCVVETKIIVKGV